VPLLTFFFPPQNSELRTPNSQARTQNFDPNDNEGENQRMCLAIPARIESIHGQKATVELSGNRFETILTLVPEAKEGDWVLVHAGFAITVLDPQEAKETYELLAEAEMIERGE
jgi:hydrogenase expression/formation protein HypC